MPLPQALEEALEKELSKISPSQLSLAAKRLSDRYRSHREKMPPFETKEERLAYLAFRMPATFAVLERLTEEIEPITSLLDIGGGPGCAKWAFEGLTSSHVIERDAEMVRLGKKLGGIETGWTQDSMENLENFRPADLLLFSYSLGEVEESKWPDILKKSFDVAEKYLMIIEPGTPEGADKILKMRQHLIQYGAQIQAPCGHNQKCPMPWCHFSVRLQRNFIHRYVKDASMGYEDEKFSYLIASKNSLSPKGLRILHTPKRHKGHIELTLCSENGLVKKTLSKKDKENYQKAKKLKWGDCF